MKKGSVVMSLIFFLASSLGVSAQCVKGNCNTGVGTKVIGKGVTYVGEFLNGRFHGKGEILKRSAVVYQGEFYQGRRQGKGVFIDKKGHRFSGIFTAGKLNGKGTIQYSNGDRYSGDVVNNLPHGTGHMVSVDGTNYQGQYIKGMRSGSGTLKMSGGTVLCGVWNNDQLISEQQGQQIKNEVVRYKDCTNAFCDGEIGIFKYGDGSLYIGEFKAGHPDGNGRCEYINGDLYEGGWKNHSPHGTGSMKFANGSEVSAIWNFGHISERIYKEESLAEYKIKPSVRPNATLGKSEIYAVIVGVASYPHLSSLKYTDDDAYQLYAFLKSPEGGALSDDHIEILIDESGTKKNIATNIQKVFSRADENDVILLYLSGHGLKGSYVPYDFDGSNNLIDYTELLDLFESSAAKNKVCITDACHSGSLVASRSGYEAGLDAFYSRIQETKSGVALMSSSSTEEVSLEYSGLRQGIFSHYLIRGLKGEANINNDNIVSISELYNYIFEQVGKYTNYAQTPSLGGDYDPGMPISWVYEN